MFQTRKEEGREKKKKAKEKRGEERGGGGLGEREKPRGRVGGWDEREREEKSEIQLFSSWLLSAVEKKLRMKISASEALRTPREKKKSSSSRDRFIFFLFSLSLFFFVSHLQSRARPCWPGRNHEFSRCDDHLSRELGAGSGGRQAER